MQLYNIPPNPLIPTVTGENRVQILNQLLHPAPVPESLGGVWSLQRAQKERY